MAFEDDLGWEYFGNDPANSPQMQEHMDWHMAPENQSRIGNYGERFLLFHKAYIEKFDVFRMTKTLLPVSGWDPATKIPAAFAHPRVLHAARHTDDPFSVAPGCKTPTWCTVTGGSDMDPVYGYTRLLQFQSMDELGRSIDSGWHGTVHNTIGGDMASFDSPIDPVFWRWHKWIDTIRSTWEAGRVRLIPRNVALLSQILFGVVNDAPGIVMGPDGIPHHIPGGPGDAGRTVFHQMPAAARDLLTGHLVNQLGMLVDSSEASDSLQKIAAQLMHSP